jgi:hypothetical protein
MLKTITLFLGVLLCSSALAEMHVWTFKDGNSLEAEFVAYSGGQISLKNSKGKIVKIPISQFGEEDLKFIELLNPPTLDLAVTKTTEQRVYPPTEPDSDSELPRTSFYEFTAKIKQTSTKIYNQELTAELFVIGKENNGDKNILYCYQKEPIHLTDGSKSYIEFKTTRITITEYVLYGQLRGEAYDGYMLLISDERGEIIASSATRDQWLDIADNLRKLPVGKTFDENGERCWPTRPGRFY